MPSTNSKPTSAPASLSLEFARDAQSGRTVLASSTQEPPLRVIRAFDQGDGAALAHLHNVSGGLLGGDHLSLCVKVAAGANAQLTTAGATRIYRPREDAAAATQSNHIHVAGNALLEYVPDAIIPFAGARFSQHTTIHLGPGAGLFWWEILAPGREAKGEVFQYESVEMKTDVWSTDRRVAAERVRIAPQQDDLASLARLGPYRFWATVYICRAGLGAANWLTVEQKLREVVSECARPGESLWGVSALVADGIAVRGLTLHGRDALSGLHALWRAAKKLLYGREPIFPRKVN